MSILTLVTIAALLLVLGAIGAFFMFINWLDKKIDKNDRLGRKSVFKSDLKDEKGNDEVNI